MIRIHCTRSGVSDATPLERMLPEPLEMISKVFDITIGGNQAIKAVNNDIGHSTANITDHRNKARADSKYQIGSGLGCRSAIASSAVMSCITACMPVRID